MYTNGTAKLVDFAGLSDWYLGLTYEQAQQAYKMLHDNNDPEWVKGCRDIDNVSWYELRGSYYRGEEESLWSKRRPERKQAFDSFFANHTEYGQPIHVMFWDDTAAVLYFGNRKCNFPLPEPGRFFEYVPEPDFSDMTPAQLRAALVSGEQNDREMVPAAAQSTMSVASVTEAKTALGKQLDNLKQQMDDVENAKTAELKKLQAEIERKEAELQRMIAEQMAVLQAKKAEMEEQVEQMQNQIWLLDSQIYSIRCYAGETVRFAHIRKGKNAPDTEPIVIHQKLRFLDEELGRLASLYEIQWGELVLFEKFLQHHPAALETFAPNERCVMLVRVSRTGKSIGMDDKQPWNHMLKTYDYYHGQTVGIIVRNGENLYLGWTDEERVHIKDDLIISQVITETVPEPDYENMDEYTRKMKEKEYKAQRRQVMDGLISRNFVYNILQGLVDNAKLLPLPKGVTLGKQSEYVIYSVADRWLKDTRFGSLNDIIKKANSRIAVGDDILAVQYLMPDNGGYGNMSRYSAIDRPWANDRGIGERNRTHDARIHDCTIYPINTIRFDKPVKMVEVEARCAYYDHSTQEWHLDDEPTLRTEALDTFEYCMRVSKTRKETDADGNNVWVQKELDPETGEYRMVEDCTGWLSGAVDYRIKRQWEVIDRHVYVSVEKTETYNRRTWEKSKARVNFELYDNEYVNLTYLNSVVLEWAINNKALGGWTIGGEPVSYAYAIRYLNTMMDYIKKREKTERKLIEVVDASITKDDEWPLKLTEFKFEKNVRSMSAYQAKRFAKWLTNK